MTSRSKANRQATRYLNTGSRAWRIQRERVLARDMYQCRVCSKFGDHVDHIDNDAWRDVPDDRLQTLCHECHSRKTAIEQAGKQWEPQGCMADGTPINPNHHWNSD